MVSLSKNSHWFNLIEQIFADKLTLAYGLILLTLILVAFIGPFIAPYGYDEGQFDNDGKVKSLQAPSLSHPLGTTLNGYDVLTRLLVGAQPTIYTGIIGGLITMIIGTLIGVVSGYSGGRTDNILMRFTDVIYGIPELPTAIVLVAILGGGFTVLIGIIALFLWRSAARVIRSQVLQIREQNYVEAAQALGASDFRIVRTHILPNVIPMAVLYFAFGTGWTILLYADLSFLGLTNPFYPAWGVMIQKSYNSGFMSVAWWWSIPPGLLIGITVLSTFMFGRRYEAIITGQARDQELIR